MQSEGRRRRPAETSSTTPARDANGTATSVEVRPTASKVGRLPNTNSTTTTTNDATTPTTCASTSAASSTPTAPSSSELNVLMDGALAETPSPRRSAKLRDDQLHYQRCLSRSHCSSIGWTPKDTPVGGDRLGSLSFRIFRCASYSSTRPLAPLIQSCLHAAFYAQALQLVH